MDSIEFFNEHNFKNTRITRITVTDVDETDIRAPTPKILSPMITKV